MDDAALVEAARRGDDSAWAGIYDRYADRLHDHCHRILRDRDEASDALHDAFLAASRNLHQLRDPERLRPWLYSICRHTSLKRVRARDRVELTDAPDEMTASEVEPDRGARQQELSELVWAAAAGLNPRDQALLDLNVRQGLEGQDLADAMGTTLNNSYVMLSRVRDQVERSLGALLIARLGRDDCSTLDGMLKGWDGKFSPLLRKRVARHVDGCETCSEKRKQVASPLALLGLAPLVPAPALLKGRVISSIRNAEVFDAPHVRFTKDGYAALEAEPVSRRVRGAWLATAAAILLLLGGFLLAGQLDDGPSTLQTAADSQTSISVGERRHTSTSSTTTEGAEDDEGEDDGDAPDDEVEDGTTSTTDDPTPGAPSGGSSTTSSTSSTSTTTTVAPVPVQITDFRLTSRSITTTRCTSGAHSTFATAFVKGSPSRVRIVAEGRGVPNVPFNIEMTDAGNGRWTAQIGPYPNTTSIDPNGASVYLVVQAYDGGRRPVWTWDYDLPVADCRPSTAPN